MIGVRLNTDLPTTCIVGPRHRHLRSNRRLYSRWSTWEEWHIRPSKQVYVINSDGYHNDDDDADDDIINSDGHHNDDDDDDDDDSDNNNNKCHFLRTPSSR